MELIGKLDEKRDAIKRSETFTVREFVLEVQSNNSQYADFVLFQVTNDRCSLLDQFNIGETLQVTFDIRGRKWTAPDNTQRVFNTLSAWRIERYNPQAAMQQGGYQQYPQQGGFQQQGYQAQPIQNGGYNQPVQQPMPQQPSQQPAADATDDLPF